MVLNVLMMSGCFLFLFFWLGFENWFYYLCFNLLAALVAFVWAERWDINKNMQQQPHCIGEHLSCFPKKTEHFVCQTLLERNPTAVAVKPLSMSTRLLRCLSEALICWCLLNSDCWWLMNSGAWPKCFIMWNQNDCARAERHGLLIQHIWACQSFTIPSLIFSTPWIS